MARTLSLTAARELFARRGPFTPAESLALRAVALAPDFAPAVNAIDGKIEDFLYTVFGPHWRAVHPKAGAAPPHLTREESVRWQVAEAAHQDARRVFEVALNAFLAARAAVVAWGERYPGGVGAFQIDDQPFARRRAAELSRAEERAEESFCGARDRLESALRALRAIERQAGLRRWWESTQRAA